MLKPIAILASVFAAIACSSTLMEQVRAIVVPRGIVLSVHSPGEQFIALTMFTAYLSACVGLAVAGIGYLRGYTVTKRTGIVCAPMLVAGVVALVRKGTQLRIGLGPVTLLGVPPSWDLRQVALHSVPATAFAAGLVGVALAILFRARGGQHGAPPNAGGAKAPPASVS